MTMSPSRRLSVFIAYLSLGGCAQRPPPEPEPDQVMSAVVHVSAGEAIAVVRGFIGRDLEDAPEADLLPLRNALRRLDATRPTDDSHPLTSRPRLVWAFGREGGSLVLDADRFGIHPGATGLRLTAFDAAGAVRARSEFSTGWRRYFNGARMVSFRDGVGPAVAVEAISFLGTQTGADFYALVGDRFDLVRVEGADGTACRNCYYIRHGTRGPRPPAQGPGEWEADLCTGDRARVLRALVWLGGHHGPIREGKEAADRQYEPNEDVTLVRAVRARAGVVSRLKALAESEDVWVREAARLALRSEDAKW